MPPALICSCIPPVVQWLTWPVFLTNCSACYHMSLDVMVSWMQSVVCYSRLHDHVIFICFGGSKKATSQDAHVRIRGNFMWHLLRNEIGMQALITTSESSHLRGCEPIMQTWTNGVQIWGKKHTISEERNTVMFGMTLRCVNDRIKILDGLSL